MINQLLTANAVTNKSEQLSKLYHFDDTPAAITGSVASMPAAQSPTALTVFTKDDLASRWDELQAVAAILTAAIMERALAKFELLELTSQCALVKFEPVQNPDPVIPILTISGTTDRYLSEMRYFITHLMAHLSVQSSTGWYRDGRKRVDIIMKHLPGKLTQANTHYFYFHLMNAITWAGVPPTPPLHDSYFLATVRKYK